MNKAFIVAGDEIVATLDEVELNEESFKKMLFLTTLTEGFVDYGDYVACKWTTDKGFNSKQTFYRVYDKKEKRLYKKRVS